jgi:hypothetical protein
MNKKIILAFAVFSAIFFSASAMGATQSFDNCPHELNYTFWEGKFVGINSGNRAGLSSNILDYTYNNGTNKYCLMQENHGILVNAKYPVKTPDNKGQAITTPLLRITRLGQHEHDWDPNNPNDPRYVELRKYSWDFQFDLLGPDGKILNTVTKEIWDYSNAAEDKQVNLSLPNGKVVFYIAIDMANDSWPGQVNAIWIESKYDLFELMKMLAGQNNNAAPCPSGGCPTGEIVTVGTCPAETNFIFKKDGFFGANKDNGKHTLLDKIAYGNNGTGCNIKENSDITINAVYNQLAQQNFVEQKKIQLLRITLLEHKINQENLSGVWKFKFELLKADGTALAETEKETKEEKIGTKSEIKLNMSLPGNGSAFDVTLNLDSPFGSNKLDVLYVEPKQDLFELMEKLGWEDSSSVTCPTGNTTECQETPSENMAKAIQKMNKKLLSGLGLE